MLASLEPMAAGTSPVNLPDLSLDRVRRRQLWLEQLERAIEEADARAAEAYHAWKAVDDVRWDRGGWDHVGEQLKRDWADTSETLKARHREIELWPREWRKRLHDDLTPAERAAILAFQTKLRRLGCKARDAMKPWPVLQAILTVHRQSFELYLACDVFEEIRNLQRRLRAAYKGETEHA
jgi:hypothetical protein